MPGDRKYKIIYADPPWGHRNKNTGGSMKSGARNHYGVMSVKDICDLRVRDIADENSFLFMWWVASMPIEALRIVSAWDYQLKTMTCFRGSKRRSREKTILGWGIIRGSNMSIAWWLGRGSQRWCLIVCVRM